MLNRSPITFKDIRSFRPDYGHLLEVLVSAVYHRFLVKDACAIDGGTNVGMHLFPMARLVGPGGRIVGFEPNPEIVARIKARSETENLSQIQMHESALFDTNGELEFEIHADKPALSHLSYPGPQAEKTKKLSAKKIRVTTVRIDDVVSDPVSFVKLDLEGAEYRALLGAKNILVASRPLIVFEHGRDAAANQFGYAAGDLLEFFWSLEYLLFDVHGMPITTRTWTLSGNEAVAIPREAPYTAVLLTFLQRFWASVQDWPIVTNWGECPRLGKDLPSLRQI